MFNTVFSGLMSSLSVDVAIDLGTSNTYVYVKGRGVACREPTVVAVHQNGRGERQVIGVGREAKAMLGRTPNDIQVIRPVRDGVIADFEITEALLRYLVKGVIGRGGMAGPRAMVCIPFGTTEVERRAMREVAESAGCRQVHLIEEPLAAAIGAGLDVGLPHGSMVIDVGGGTTEVAVISMSEIVYSRSLRVGGDQMDESLVQYLKKHEGILIGPRTSEEIKMRLGSAVPHQSEQGMWIKGRDITTGYPKSVRVTTTQVYEALSECVQLIIEAVLSALEKTPPELASDIVDMGIVMSGGGSLLHDLDRAVSRATGVPVIRAEDPMSTVVHGSFLALQKTPRTQEKAVGLTVQI